MKRVLFLYLALSGWARSAEPAPAYVIVGTGQTKCYDNHQAIPAPQPGQPFYGQDAQHPGHAPAYKDNGDGTISDLNTGLMWVKARGAKATWEQAVAGAAACRAGGHTDWRMPAIKELYSLINFNGGFHRSAAGSTPYLEAQYFDFVYGDEARGERGIDCQDWSANEYASTQTASGVKSFGVNFADGRIKGYGRGRSGRPAHEMYYRYVRGNPNYGKNDFHDHGDGTVTDRATGLMWAQADSGQALNWQDALAWAQKRNAEKYLGYRDWRLPNAKELQSIVDYTRAPQADDPARRGPAIDPLFQVSKLSDGDYPFFWTSTTHLDGPADAQGSAAIYLAFGRATGWMSPQAGPPGRGGPGRDGPPGLGPPGGGDVQLMDVHGAGAQRSDPKAGDPAAFPHGRGPQGDVIRIYNFARLVRGG